MSAVTDARPAVEAIQASGQEVREVAPKLLSELGDLGSSVGAQKLEGMSRYLERFELTVQRIQQDLNGLSSGVSDAAPSAQRLADSLEFLNQVIRGLSGEESGIAIQKVTGADSEQRLKTVVQRNQQYTASVRKAIGAADALAKAQTAARALPLTANTLTTELANRRAARRCRRRLQAVDTLLPGTGGAFCWERWPGPIRRPPTNGAAANCACARTSATRRPSCACSTSCRAWRTAT